MARLVGPVVIIEQLAPEYFEQIARWLSDPAVNVWLTPEWRNRVVDKALIGVAVRNARNCLFLVRCDDRPCGLVALAELDVVDRIAMVWYALGEGALAGRGIMTEAVTQLVRHAFQVNGLQSVYAWTMANNIASGRVLAKAGFRCVGRVRNASLSDGQQVDRIYYDLIPTDGV